MKLRNNSERQKSVFKLNAARENQLQGKIKLQRKTDGNMSPRGQKNPRRASLPVELNS